MKTITEADAQELANLLRMWIAVDADCFPCLHHKQPFVGTDQHVPAIDAMFAIPLPVRIASDRPWTEQIWGPE